MNAVIESLRMKQELKSYEEE